LQKEILPTTKFVVIAVAIYLVWTIATYLLEGRIHLLQKPSPLERLTYAVISNMVIGTVIAIWLLKLPIVQRFVTVNQLGFQMQTKRIIIAVIIAGLIGFALFVIQKPASLNPIVILNVFAQALPTTIAEVVVCWAVVGTAFESIYFKRKSKKVVSIILAATASTVLFGVYHFAHSPPFNQPNMVLFLIFPGVLTSIVYFVGRDIYATIVFHNFQALFGVMNNVNIESLLHPMYPVIIIAIVSIVILVISDLLSVRKTEAHVHDTSD
jgi:CAAX prenyl protease-like protein